MQSLVNSVQHRKGIPTVKIDHFNSLVPRAAKVPELCEEAPILTGNCLWNSVNELEFQTLYILHSLSE